MNKTCTNCGETKPLDAFYRRKDGSQGRAARCKACHAAYFKRRYADPEYAERIRQGVRQRRKADPDAVRERERQQRIKHRDKKRARDRRYREENRERLRAKGRARYRVDAEKIKARMAQWVKDNPGRHRDNAHKRRARMAGAAISPADMAQIIVELKRQPCVYCGATERIEIDHVIPLCRGGAHEPENLAPACKSCNCSKGRRLLSEWPLPT